MKRCGLFVLFLLLSACGSQPAVKEEMQRIDGVMPADFSGSWQRNYARDDEIGAVLNEVYYRLSREAAMQQGMQGRNGEARPSRQKWESIVALARLAELITRPDTLTIHQDDYEIRVDRKDDFSLQCSFFNGVAKGIESPYGTEICGWDGNQLVSVLSLPDGVRITHRFTVSENREELRIVTAVSSSVARTPFTLRRFYTRFERPAPGMQCVETLSMKRVCSTGELEL